MSINKIFSENVKKFRKDKGLSQDELASLSSLHRTYIGSVERGERNVSLNNVEKIAIALNVDVIALLKENK